MPLKTHTDEMPSINLTPMIDIIFQLIIFFMVGSRFTDFEERRIGLNVPRVPDASSLSAPVNQAVIYVHADGNITLNRERISPTELTEKLAEAGRAKQKVLVRGDASCRFQTVAEVLNACKQAGIEDLGVSVKLAVRPENVR